MAECPKDVRDELADVFLGVLRFADVGGIGLEVAVREKMVLNGRKYVAPGG